MWDAGKFTKNAGKFAENVAKFIKMLITLWTKKNLNKNKNDHVER